MKPRVLSSKGLLWFSFCSTLTVPLILITQLLQSCLTLCNPMDCSLPGSLTMGFSLQEYWSGLPFPPPGDYSPREAFCSREIQTLSSAEPCCVLIFSGDFPCTCECPFSSMCQASIFLSTFYYISLLQETFPSTPV